MARNETGLGNSLSRFVIVISALAVGLSLATKGFMSAPVLLVFLILVVIAASLGSTLTRAVLAIFALGFFVLDYVNYDVNAFSATIGPVLGLLGVLFGFFVMVGGFRRR